MTFLDHLYWRHATKEFDPKKKVSEKNLQKILEAIRLTPTSFGLQPYHVIVITDQKLKEKIRTLSWDQPQVTTCSYLLVFCARTDSAQRIDQYLEIASEGKSEIREKLVGYEKMMRGSLGKMDFHWASRQAYIAHGFALAACAELEIDSCPMEGFDPEKLDQLLELPEHFKSIVMLPIGYRKEDPKREKVRFGEEDLFEKR
ncbi:NAD(P)H-dependent oxidoreductase [Candidatus Gracilibacteria bacterium]|nr:NAD(P)H-dependent oxidoreductase [Candidatus Gracilibacteria bacterium]MCF7819349.1 NAD(P)H-dependent oxidoreductase [Candidatus Gracilibacteria bacterium]